MWLVLLIVIVVLVLAYLFVVAPNRKRRSSSALHCEYFAHRGLHDERAPENSLAAFRRAVEKGYGIEIDVQLTKDDQIVVFHDMHLQRMCGADKLVPDLTLRELREYRLLDTDERIPTLDEVLDVVRGRVPLLVEIKLSPRLSDLTKLVALRMRMYRGEFLMQSFAPQAMQLLKRVAPEMLRGQLVAKFDRKNRSLPFIVMLPLSNLCLNCLSRPDFIAYQKGMEKSLILRVMRSVYHANLAVWTITSQQEIDALREYAGRFIFEGFEPEREQAL